MRSSENGIHLFDREDFKHIKSIGVIGKGPGEITRLGWPTNQLDSARKFHMPDHGKFHYWIFDLDSILMVQDYLPQKGPKFREDLFFYDYQMLDDSNAIGAIARVTSQNSFVSVLGRSNIYTGIQTIFDHTGSGCPSAMSNFYFSLTPDGEIYVKSYSHCDLLILGRTNGDLIGTIKGPDWKAATSSSRYFRQVHATNQYLYASFNGAEAGFVNAQGRPESNGNRKFLVFDLKGKYVKTLELGSRFHASVLDKDNGRIIAHFIDRDNPLGYINIDFEE